MIDLGRLFFFFSLVKKQNTELNKLWSTSHGSNPNQNDIVVKYLLDAHVRAKAWLSPKPASVVFDTPPILFPFPQNPSVKTVGTGVVSL